MRILAIDPGADTGWALFDPQAPYTVTAAARLNPTKAASGQLLACGLSSPRTLAAAVDGLLGPARGTLAEGEPGWSERVDEVHAERPKRIYPRRTEAQKAARKEWERRSQTENPIAYLLYSAKSRAKAKAIPFTLVPEGLSIPETCPLLGIPLVRKFGSYGPSPGSPSLDRIDPSLGYVPGNVWVISHRANVIKNDATLEELEMIVKSLKARLACS